MRNRLAVRSVHTPFLQLSQRFSRLGGSAHISHILILYKDKDKYIVPRVWSYSVMVITQAFEACNLGSTPSRTWHFYYYFFFFV